MSDSNQLILTKIKPQKFKKKIIDKNSNSDDIENNEIHKFLLTIQFIIDNYNDLKPDINDDIFTPSKLIENENLKISSTTEVPSDFPLISINKIKKVFNKNRNKVPNFGDVWNYCFRYSGEKISENSKKNSNPAFESSNKNDSLSSGNNDENEDDENVPKSLVSLYEYQKYICSIYEMCLHILRNMGKSKSGNMNDPKYLASWLLESKVLQQECEKYNWVKMKAKFAAMNDEVMSLTVGSSGNGKIREKQMSYLKKNDFGIQCHSTVGVKTSSVNEKILNDDEISKNRIGESDFNNSSRNVEEISKISDDDDFINEDHDHGNKKKRKIDEIDDLIEEKIEGFNEKKKKKIEKKTKNSDKSSNKNKKSDRDYQKNNNNKDSPDEPKFDIEEAFKDIENSGKNNGKKKIKLNRSIKEDESENMFDDEKEEDQDIDDDHDYDFF